MLKVRSFNFSDFPVLGSGGGGPAESGRGSEGRSQGSHEEQGGEGREQLWGGRRQEPGGRVGRSVLTGPVRSPSKDSCCSVHHPPALRLHQTQALCRPLLHHEAAGRTQASLPQTSPRGEGGVCRDVSQRQGGGSHQEALETGEEEEEEGLCWSLSQQEEETKEVSKEEENEKTRNRLNGTVKLFSKFDFYLRYKVDTTL